MKPLVTIIILNYNMKGLIKLPLDSLRKTKYPKNKLQIVVIDNNSTDGSMEFIKENYSEAQIIKNKVNTGYAAMNLAIPHIKGKYAFFLNNDLKLDPMCIQKLVDAIESTPKHVVGVTPERLDIKTGEILYTRKYLSKTFYLASTKKDFKKNTYPEAATGIPFFKTTELKKLKPFIDPDYFLYAEDLDFCYRLRIKGFEIHHVRDSLIYNMGRVTTKKFQKKAGTIYLSERNLLQTAIKDLETKNLLLYLPYILGVRVLSLFKSLFTLEWSIFKAKLRGYYWVMKNLGLILKKRKEVQKTRTTSDRQIFSRIGNEKLFMKKEFGFHFFK